jgi:hypothetical protein
VGSSAASVIWMLSSHGNKQCDNVPSHQTSLSLTAMSVAKRPGVKRGAQSRLVPGTPHPVLRGCYCIPRQVFCPWCIIRRVHRDFFCEMQSSSRVFFLDFQIGFSDAMLLNAGYAHRTPRTRPGVKCGAQSRLVPGAPRPVLHGR